MTLRRVTICAVGLLFCVSVGFANEKPQPQQPVADLAKTAVIELPAKLLVAESSAVRSKDRPFSPATDRDPAVAEPAPADVGKADIELPAKEVLAGTRRNPPTEPAGPPANPKVAPGKVAWHPDFVSACAASRKSGKPVLHFQLLGNLDDRFC
jgi:hypothetical protein